jgi:hypothetical protein
MNERIDDLAFQSGITQHSYSNPKHPDLDGFIVSQEKLEKFAELIVRECSLIPDWCIETGKDQFVETCMAERTSKMIKQHFGVSE